MIWRAHYDSGSLLGRTPGELGYATIHHVNLYGIRSFEVLDPVGLHLDADERLICFYRGAVSSDGTVSGRYMICPKGREVYVLEGSMWRVMPGWGTGIDGPPAELSSRGA